MKNKWKILMLVSFIFITIGGYTDVASAAGLAKPENVDQEVEYEVLGVVGANQSGGTLEKCGLFDGTQVDEWSTPPVMYWYENGNFLEINIKKNCNVWRSGTGYTTYNSPLKVSKWNGKEYVDITSTIEQTLSAINHRQWEKTISNLPAGQYRFDYGTGYRIDSEWYLEAVDTNTLKVVLEPKEELQLSVDDALEENINMTWISSDESVATVDETGVVTALKKGDVTITVKSKDGKYTDKIYILVVDDATELRLALDMKVGTTRRVTIDDLTDTKTVTWNSMDPEIAVIDTKGKITAVSKGLVLITATDKNGKIVGTVYVRVRN